MSDYEKTELAYDFFLQRLQQDGEFTTTELMEATGWAKSSVYAYRTKKWKGLLEPLGGGRFRVRHEFRRLTRRRFLEHSSQNTPIFTSYTLKSYDSVLTYELLLPLSREPELRLALDELFYTDTLQDRVLELGIPSMEKWIPRVSGETDAQYVERAAVRVGDLFSGYSISHVGGRFRAEDLSSRSQAAALAQARTSYLIDETTASVRFIIPLNGIAGEIAETRDLFLKFFAEGIIRLVRENEIWLLEDSQDGRKLFIWRQIP